MAILGQGNFIYTPIEGWGNFPDEIIIGDVAGIAIDSRDRVYLFNRGFHPVVVLDQNGEVLSTWGHGLFKNPHGASIGPDQCIYLTDNFNHTVKKFTLDGKLLLELGTDGISSGFMSGKPFCKCTHSTVATNGDIYVSDGYSNACVHHYDPSGKLIKSWGGPGTGPGEFNLPHNICCDIDNFIYVADRENSRVQIFDRLGRFEDQINNMHRPSGLALTEGTYPHCIVGELASYSNINNSFPNLGPFVSFFSRDGSLISRLDKGQGPGLEPGQFISPHSIAYDSLGNLYVGEVAQTDWQAVMGQMPMPLQLRRFQKLEKKKV